MVTFIRAVRALCAGLALATSAAAPTAALDAASRARLPSPAYRSLDTGTLDIVGADDGTGLTARGTGGYWIDRPGGARFQRLTDRVLIGPDAAAWPGRIASNGTSWPWTMGKGIFGYLPRNAMVWASNPFGSIGILSSSQTADSAKLPGEPGSACCAIPFASLVRNNNSAVPQPAWGYYATTVREAGAGDTHNAEFDIANATGTVVRIGPYRQDTGGITVGLALNAGGEAAPYNNPADPPYRVLSAASAALQIAGNGSTFDKGIVVKAGTISPTADGSTVALDLPAGHLIRWAFDGSDATGAFLNSYVSSAATQTGIQFDDSGTSFQNRDASAIYAKINHIPNARNFPLISPSAAGQAVRFEALGADPDVPVQIGAKGAAAVNLSGQNIAFINPGGACIHTAATSAETVACFSDERLKKDIEDAGSGLDYLAGMRVRDFALRSDGSRHTGVIAQEVQAAHPEMVHAGADGMLMVDAPNPWVLVQAIQELRTRQVVLAWIAAGLGLWSLGLTVFLVADRRRRAA